MAVLHPTITFVGQMASHWRETGALVPSGKRLARTMAGAIGHVGPDDVIVELGPGTGVFTQELLKNFPLNRVVAVEFNHAFVTRLQTTMPAATVIEGCASRLPELLAGTGVPVGKVAAVISGLPLLSLDRKLSESVIRAIATVLRPGGRYVQFTYSRRAWRKFDVPGFRPEPHHRVWLNVPPAVVMPFVRATG
jgi:phosphatidylethanolamine/phosphatidyl-N-methylethanolamine N-methyltransferase